MRYTGNALVRADIQHGYFISYTGIVQAGVVYSQRGRRGPFCMPGRALGRAEQGPPRAWLVVGL